MLFWMWVKAVKLFGAPNTYITTSGAFDICVRCQVVAGAKPGVCISMNLQKPAS